MTFTQQQQDMTVCLDGIRIGTRRDLHSLARTAACYDTEPGVPGLRAIATAHGWLITREEVVLAVAALNRIIRDRAALDTTQRLAYAVRDRLVELEEPTVHSIGVTTVPPMSDIEVVYRERAHLLAYLASDHPSVLLDPSPDLGPDYVLLFVGGPTGQMSWHLAARDVDLLKGVPRVDRAHPMAIWDGHTTSEKYARLDRLTRSRRPVAVGDTACG